MKQLKKIRFTEVDQTKTPLDGKPLSAMNRAEVVSLLQDTTSIYGQVFADMARRGSDVKVLVDPNRWTSLKTARASFAKAFANQVTPNLIDVRLTTVAQHTPKKDYLLLGLR